MKCNGIRVAFVVIPDSASLHPAFDTVNYVPGSRCNLCDRFVP